LRAITYEYNEFSADNIGVEGGPGMWTFGQTVSTNKFMLKANVFAGTGSSIQDFGHSQRFTLVNAPEYLRKQGDMAISYVQKRIYFIPYSTAHITGGTDSDAQVLNVSLPAPASIVEGDPDPNKVGSTYEAPLIIQERPGFQLENVDFSCCAGEGLYLLHVGVENSTTDKMVIKNCTFSNMGLVGLSIRHCWNTITRECSFQNIQGRAYNYAQAHKDYSNFLETYKSHRIQENLGHYLWNCTFDRTGMLHPTMFATRISQKPCGFVAAGNSYSHVSGSALMFSGTQGWIQDNTFSHCSQDVAEFGVVYTGRSISNFGNRIYFNTFSNCNHGSDFGSNQFDQLLSGIMLDDNCANVDVGGNDFQAIGSGSEIHALQVNGGSFNRFIFNKFPSQTSMPYVLVGWLATNGIGSDGTYLTGSSLYQLLDDVYPIPTASTDDWKYNSSQFTDVFTDFAGFNGSTGHVYYGDDLVNPTGEPARYTIVNGVHKWRSDYFWTTPKKSEWFVEKAGSWCLRMRGNQFFWNSELEGNGSSLSTRLQGDVVNSGMEFGEPELWQWQPPELTPPQ